MPTADDLLNTFESLSPDEKAKATKAINVRALPDPPKDWVGPLWVIVVGTLACALLGGLVLIYLLDKDSKSTSDLVPLITLAAGALVGLMAPSPVASK